jgi:hypothetical protein
MADRPIRQRRIPRLSGLCFHIATVGVVLHRYLVSTKEDWLPDMGFSGVPQRDARQFRRFAQAESEARPEACAVIDVQMHAPDLVKA